MNYSRARGFSSISRVLEDLIAAARARFIRPLVHTIPSWVTPNHLTGVRLLLAAAVAGFLWHGQLLVAAGAYLGAILTDALDGELARHRGQVTWFGTRFDPAADKALHAVVFLFFWSQAPALFSLLLAADAILFLSSLVLSLTPRVLSLDLSASVFGRWKMILQSLGCVTLFGNALAPTPALRMGGELLLGAALVFAVLSAVGYLRRLPLRSV